MKTITTLGILGLSLTLQSCNLFDGTGCNNKQVVEAVKKLYASQVNIKPLSTIDQMQHQFNPNYNQVNIQMQSTVGINVSDIKQLNTDKSKLENKTESEDFTDIIVERFSDAKYICEGTIQQIIPRSTLDHMPKELSKEELALIENGRVKIPVIYAVHSEDGSDQFEVQYSPKNPAYLMMAIMLQQPASDAKNGE